MSEFSQPREEESSDNEIDSCAKILIECDKNGEISFFCDWEPGEDGVSCLSTILSILGRDGISDIIFNNIEQNAEKTPTEELEKIKSLYKTIEKINKQNTKDKTEAIITPLDIIGLL